MHFSNSFQGSLLQMPWSCSTYFFWPCSHVPKFIQIVNCPKDSMHIQVNRLQVLEQTATHSRFCSSVFLWPSELLFTVMILDDYGLFIIIFWRILLKGGEKTQIIWIFGACVPLFLLFQQLLQSGKESQIIASNRTDKHREASLSAQLEAGLLWLLERLWHNKFVETWGSTWKSTYWTELYNKTKSIIIFFTVGNIFYISCIGLFTFSEVNS